jgi:NarL family two-component system sensor histidine kinase LiaS
MVFKRIFNPFRRLQWRLTFSYSAVTVGSLIIVVLVLGYLVFSRVFIPLEIYDSELSPSDWIRIANTDFRRMLVPFLSQDPVDTDLLAGLLQESDAQITHNDLLQIGDFQIRLRTVGQAAIVITDENGILLGSSDNNFVHANNIGKTLNLNILPGLEGAMKSALDGELNPDKIFVTLEPHKSFYFVLPIVDRSEYDFLGTALVYLQRVPTANDIPSTLGILVGRSTLILLLAAGLVGTIFGALTARSMVSRLERVSNATDAWSQGDFSNFIDDSQGDEISQLSVRLNHMAEQLQRFLTKSQEIAVSEERNRLARDLHDSAKQEALAASFHLGTALTLIESDPGSAKNHLVEADNLVDSVRRELTDLIHELRPVSMNGTKFDETINEYIIEWAHQTGIKAHFIVEGMVDLPLETKQAIYRILQEALANVSKHSAAQNVEVSMQFGEILMRLCISDDGTGFDIHQTYDGMGLDSMRERVESLNGDFSIQSETEAGTKICITIPIK